MPFEVSQVMGKILHQPEPLFGETGVLGFVHQLVRMKEKARVSVKIGERVLQGTYFHKTRLNILTSLMLDILEPLPYLSMTLNRPYTFCAELQDGTYAFRTRIRQITGSKIEIDIPNVVFKLPSSSS